MHHLKHIQSGSWLFLYPYPKNDLSPSKNLCWSPILEALQVTGALEGNLMLLSQAAQGPGARGSG